MFASHRQIDTAVRNALRLRDITAADERRYRAELAGYTVADVDRVIKAQNARTGWTAESPATDRQRRYLAHLEKKVLGIITTMPSKPLTSKEAASQIAYLADVAKQIDAQVAAATVPENVEA